MRLLRLLRILAVSLRFGLEEFLLGHERVRGLRPLINAVLFWRPLHAPRAVRLRLALETLGPIFVKFGQVLSTRRDLLPADIADELAKLQDRVPPFDSRLVRQTLERGYQRRIEEVFARFEAEPIASASVAQVHLAELKDGTAAAVKVLRPGIAGVIGHDVALLYSAASLVQWLWRDGRRFKPREVVAEFQKHLDDELDLMREAASASQLRRNFAASPLLRVPEVYWDYCSSQVMVMERMTGTPISQVDSLRAQGVDLKHLARSGVEIFFTQVFRDGFFHADMHPGNILVDAQGRYVALDFGIMGTLTEVDKNYLAQNFLAFFRRDYRRCGAGAPGRRLGSEGYASGRVRIRHPRGVRAGVRPAAARDLLRPRAAAPVPDVPALQHRGAAAAGAAAEDAAEHRGPGPPARSRPGSVDDSETLSRSGGCPSSSAGAGCGGRFARKRPAGVCCFRNCLALCTGP